VSFLSADAAQVSTIELAAFAQDAWTARPWLTVESGLRYDDTTALGGATISPRVAWTAKAGRLGTTLSGSAGVFGDKIPLDALTFRFLPARVVEEFEPVHTTTEYTNVIDPRLRTPRAARWNVELNQQFARGWMMRTRYEERRGRDELVVEVPLTGVQLASALSTRLEPMKQEAVLQSSGFSSARSAEVTVGYRNPQSRGELYVSYVRASTRGDQNSLDAIDGTFKAPFVQPNQIGALAVDVPHRVLAWGLVHLPSRITVAPFLEVRSGFPYTAIDEAWRNVGTPNAYRFPWFGSLDLSVNKIVSLPRRLPAARVGFKLYNVGSAHTEREVQRDLMRNDFGSTYDPIPRDFTIVFEFLWGHR
jgi:hypothetical protein